MDKTEDTAVHARIDSLHKPGLVDMHYDLLMDLYEKRARENVLATDHLPQLEAGGIGVLAAAIYLEDEYLPEMALRVTLDQVARLYSEASKSVRFAICKSYADITQARQSNKIALLITMEGIEPLGSDINLLRVFYELGLRSLSLTHARRNAAGDGAVFAPSGSPHDGLTAFGRQVIRECEAMGIIVDLAHLSPAGFDQVLEMTSRPVVVSHAGVRKYWDIERNVSDEQIREIGRRGGVIGLNAVLVSAVREEATLDRFVDHIEHVVSLAGIKTAGLGFDFFKFVYDSWPEQVRVDFDARFGKIHFVDGLSDHSHSRNVTRKLIERGFSDLEVSQILYGNWMRIFRELL